MDNLQYHDSTANIISSVLGGFKPYYKWITFNTRRAMKDLRDVLVDLGF